MLTTEQIIEQSSNLNPRKIGRKEYLEELFALEDQWVNYLIITYADDFTKKQAQTVLSQAWEDDYDSGYYRVVERRFACLIALIRRVEAAGK